MLEDRLKLHEDLKFSKPSAVLRIQNARKQAEHRAETAEEMSAALCFELEVQAGGFRAVCQSEPMRPWLWPAVDSVPAVRPAAAACSLQLGLHLLLHQLMTCVACRA